MHSADFDLLRRVAAGEITAVKLPAELDAHINYLISRGWIVRTMPGRYFLTDSGKAAMWEHSHLSSEQQQPQYKPQHNKHSGSDMTDLDQQQRKSLRDKLLVAVTGPIITALFDHAGDILQFIRRLLQRIAFFVSHH